MTYNSTITSKGQITLPKQLRDKTGLRSGTTANVSLLDNRTIVIKAPLPVEMIRSSIGKPSHKQPLSDKEKRNIKARDL